MANKRYRVAVAGLGHWYSGFGLARAMPEYKRADLVDQARRAHASSDREQD